MTNFDVKKIRLTMGLSQTQFASQVGISQGTLAKIESNLIHCAKYETQIRSMIDGWKKLRINSLQQEIDFLKSL